MMRARRALTERGIETRVANADSDGGARYADAVDYPGARFGIVELPGDETRGRDH
ncbi:hypothetical protein [Salarchaeum sp. JOR-1]|uniref:hypothetical protein n=1 Tax=Salarchaeum sp. JOR-1 TaxID=2599399 RepID=UPI00143CE8C7|nr:hypothetical protein [Salarchaeum sp. JOR-1]